MSTWSVLGENRKIDWCLIKDIEAHDPDEACWKAMNEHGMIQIFSVERMP